MSVFTGDINKLVAAPMLQDSFVDKDGTPISGGTITCYHDNSRTTLKNWYYQSGTPGTYTYITLPNPLTLSAAGTICDINGVDTIPFFYPWDENDDSVHDPYYITIVNQAMTNQITRANFPFEGGGGGGGETVDTFNDLIINNGFWRNIAPNSLNVTPSTSFVYSAMNMSIPPGGTLQSIIVAPGNHDGFRMPDIEFLKNNFTGTDSVVFTPFTPSTSLAINNPPTISGEYYISHTSSVSTGVTQKCYQFPISLHVNSLANAPFTFTIQAQNDPVGGTSASTLSIFIFQDTGTGGSPSPSTLTPIPITQITTNTTWTTYSVSGIFPSTVGLTLGAGADDGLYLQVQLPLNTASNINFTKPSIYLTSSGVFPLNDYQTYDQVDSIINSPRTGDIRTSLNSFYFFGWLPMNDGTIGNKASATSSNATLRANADTWQLYNLIWNAAAPYSASGAGTTNPLAQMYTSAGAAVGYGPNITVPSTAYADFIADKQLSLSKMMGKVMLGTVPIAALLPATTTIGGFKSIVTGSNAGGVLLLTAPSNILNLFKGAPITFTNTGGALPGNITANTVYYVAGIGLSFTFVISTTFDNAMAGVLVAYASDGTGTTTAYLDLTASVAGEYAHMQLLGEMINHRHNPLNGVGFLDEDAALNLGAGASTSAISAGTTGLVTGYPASQQASVQCDLQPGTFYNMFIKL